MHVDDCKRSRSKTGLQVKNGGLVFAKSEFLMHYVHRQVKDICLAHIICYLYQKRTMSTINLFKEHCVKALLPAITALQCDARCKNNVAE